jgi:hypothetical protein
MGGIGAPRGRRIGGDAPGAVADGVGPGSGVAGPAVAPRQDRDAPDEQQRAHGHVPPYHS